MCWIIHLLVINLCIFWWIRFNTISIQTLLKQWNLSIWHCLYYNGKTYIFHLTSVWKFVYFFNNAHVNLMDIFIMKCMMYVSVELLLDIDNKAFEPNFVDVGWCYSTTEGIIEQNSELILSRNNSPLDCLHLALAHRYHFVWRRHENMSLCTGSRVISNYERIASRVVTQFQVSKYQRHLPPTTVMPNVLTTQSGLAFQIDHIYIIYITKYWTI